MSAGLVGWQSGGRAQPFGGQDGEGGVEVDAGKPPAQGQGGDAGRADADHRDRAGCRLPAMMAAMPATRATAIAAISIQVPTNGPG
jgi:hypothetical protein